LRPDRFPERARAARDKVLLRMGQLGVLTRDRWRKPGRNRCRSGAAPCLFWRPIWRLGCARTRPDATLHRTIPRPGLQQTLENLGRQQQSALEPAAVWRSWWWRTAIDGCWLRRCQRLF